jgi:hypothetical protein
VTIDARAHGMARGALVWVLLLPFRALWGTVKTVLALLGEEVRRWFALVLWGLMLWPVAQASARWYRPLLPWVLLAVLVWLWACVRAVRWTLHNRLAAVRAREFYKRLDQRTGELGDKLGEAVRSARDGGGKWALHRSTQPHPRSAPEAAATLDEVQESSVEFEPVFPLPWRRRR